MDWGFVYIKDEKPKGTTSNSLPWMVVWGDYGPEAKKHPGGHKRKTRKPK